MEARCRKLKPHFWNEKEGHWEWGCVRSCTAPRNQFSLVLPTIEISFQKGGSLGLVLHLGVLLLPVTAPFCQLLMPSLTSLVRQTDPSCEG